MKKIAVLGLSLLSVSVAQAQDAGGRRIGVKVGATYSSISGDNVSRITGPNFDSDLGSYKLGYNVGVGTSFPISSDGFFSIAPELLYNRKGYEISSTRTTGLPTGVTSIESEQQRVLHYLDLPILAKINAGGLFFELGPQVSYLFGSKNKQQTTTKFSNGDKDKVENDGSFLDYSGVSRGERDKSDLAQFDISGVAGIGYQTEGGLSLGLRYARGFNSLIDSKDTDNEPKAFNNAFTLQLGYLLPLGQ
ncbi:PorT family protein [Hymenobacter sp. BT683]|uniref:PorT family protein n=1 Tax=Hymenobacter jeongseonensis TaxID=2791027 RepID=A0ABS0IDN8_9BACT|nr:porin family protein [Hymenobacter jeongseonensis]MBF9236463.1 PorT family protein [Hymenobacter jeongseonensis]